MGKRYLYLFVSILLLATSCSAPQQDEAEYQPPKFKHEYKVEIKKLNEDIMLDFVAEMFLQDSVVILYSHNADNDNAFQVLSAETGEFIGSFANTGRGHGELVMFDMTAITPDGSKLYSVDQNNKLVSYDLAKAISGKPNYIERSEYLFGRNTTMQIHALSDSTFLHVEGWRARHFSTDTYFVDTLARYNDYPVISRRFAESTDSLMTKMYFANHSLSAIKPDRRKFVATAYYGFLMQIFDIGQESIDLAKTLYFYEPKMKNYIAATDDCVAGPVDISTTDKYIYVLYGCEPQTSVESTRMGVFDWNGKPVDCYTFDYRPYRIAVTPDDKRVYCWSKKGDGEEFFGYIDLKHE